jgi:hypothetical protein
MEDRGLGRLTATRRGARVVRRIDSRVLSWAKDSDLIGTRATVLTGHTFGNEVEQGDVR